MNLWLYFQSVINWVKAVFPKYRKEMKGIQWGFLYNDFKDKKFDHKKLEEEISKLMQDEDVDQQKRDLRIRFDTQRKVFKYSYIYRQSEKRSI
jgi:hypothetical protein